MEENSEAERDTDVSTLKPKPRPLPPSGAEKGETSTVRKNLFPRDRNPTDRERRTRAESVTRGEEGLRKLALSSASRSSSVHRPPGTISESNIENTDDTIRELSERRGSFYTDFTPLGLQEITDSIVGQLREIPSSGSAVLAAVKELYQPERTFEGSEKGLAGQGTEADIPGAFPGRAIITIPPAGIVTPTVETVIQTPPVIMTTSFPKDIRIKDLKEFDGTPSELESFDNAIKQCLIGLNFPIYYGGYVIGDPDSDYIYVAPGTANAKSNYIVGRRLCAALTSKLKDNAKKWWEDYDAKGESPPNCWRKHADMKTPVDNGHGTVVEVSMYDLMKSYFSGEVDARTAEIELGKFKWEPFKKDGLSLIAFRTSIERLLKRAQKTSTFEKVRSIRNALPQNIKDRTELTETVEDLWKKISAVHMTMEVDLLDKPQSSTTCLYCEKIGHSVDVCRKKAKDSETGLTVKSNANKPRNQGQNGGACTRCGNTSHAAAGCFAKRHADGTPLADTPKTQRSATTATASTATAHGATSARVSYNTGTNAQNNMAVNQVRVCYRCNKEGHIARFCTATPAVTQTVTQANIGTTSREALANYSISIVDTRCPATRLVEEEIDERSVVLTGSVISPLPLYHLLSQSYIENEVFTVPKLETVPRPAGCLWTMCETPGGQQLLTVWDTGACVCVAPVSSMVQTKTKWSKGADVNFIMADGVQKEPLGMAEKFVFRVKEKYFAVRVYVVDTANYQLLLGTEFMVTTGVGLFPRWGKVIMTIPSRIELEACCKRITASVGAPPLVEEDMSEIDEEEFDGLATVSMNFCLTFPNVSRTSECNPIYPFYRMSAEPKAIQVGMRDLTGEVENVEIPQIEISSEDLARAKEEGLPVLTVDFIRSNLKFGPSVPEQVQVQVCQDVIDYADVFSWNQFDLGCIEDVPHTVNRFDNTASIQSSRRHLYNPINERIIKAKCWPLVELGIYKRAPPECIDRAQLTIVKDKCGGLASQRNEPAFCRVAHDYRDYNGKIYLDPEPCDNINEMMAWMGNSETGSFFKMDADRGFNQIVMSKEATLGSAFEMLGQLWVSERMLFGMKNGPATFKRNAVVMQGQLLLDKLTKSYFDDILGKCTRGDYRQLRSIWLRLLEAMRKHGWKCKLRKCEWGFETIESVGFVWSEAGISMASKSINSMKSMRLPCSISELRGFLGLANQFRDRVPGFALMVANLTALTRASKTPKITLNPEAIMEFENMKAFLVSPVVLQQFRYDRKTIVYTDACIGTQDGAVSGGLGVVIVQVDGDTEYVCCFASSGLSPAQRNYHIVRLELLAFVYACGKFNEWLSCMPFVWRTDCRAHQYINEAKQSPNQTIARYALALADYTFTVEWIPGVKMIADPLSRLMLVPAGQDSMSLAEICFGEYGRRIHAERTEARGSSTPVMFYTPTAKINLCEEVMVDMEFDEGVRTERVVRWCPVPVSEMHSRMESGSYRGDEAESGMDNGERVQCGVSTQVVMDMPMFTLRTEEMIPEAMDNDFNWSALSKAMNKSESEKMAALPHLRDYVATQRVPDDARLAKTVRALASKVTLTDGKLWRLRRDGEKVEVLDKVERVREVLLMLHEGMGHRGIGSCYMMFQRSYWIPGAAKLIGNHIMACKVCQEFSKPNPLASPGYSVKPTDVFSHWSIDFAGPFPEDLQTGCRFVILAVDWLSRWVEGAACKDASPETAAEFLYEYVVTRYGCPLSLQSDNGPHFVNPIIRSLCGILRIKHHFSTPYYPQSNGKIERVVGTVKTMLKRAVREASQESVENNENEGNVIGVGAVVDAEVLDKVREGEEGVDVLVEDEGMSGKEAKIHWAPLLQSVLWAYRATPHSKTKLSPAMLALGTELRMPFEMNVNGKIDIPESDEDHKKLVAMRLNFLCDGIPGLREVRDEKHIGRGNWVEYAVGQKVWKRESKFDGKGFTPVFAPRWTGPFVVHAVWDKNVYKLRSDPTITGKRVGYLKNPINGSRLRAFVEGEVM